MTEEIEVEIVDEIVDDTQDAEESLPDPRAEGIYHREEGKKHQNGGKSARMDSLTWACILIWAGAVMLADNLDFLTRLEVRSSGVPWGLPVSAEVWSIFFLGVGVILLVGVILRLLVPKFRYDVLGNAILTIVAFSIALGRAELIWPLILIALGVSVITRKV
jgi:hypothetical protein